MTTKADAMALLREEWKRDKADVICGLMNCECPGDEWGADAARCICMKAAAYIDGLQAVQFFLSEAAKVAPKPTT